MTPPTDSQRRLLDAIAARLPVERVHELYLFSPMRQGGVETGIAVVAAGDPSPPPEAHVGDDVVAEALSPGTVEGDVQTPELMRAVMDAAEAAVEAGDEAEPDEVADDPTEAEEIADDALALAAAELEELGEVGAEPATDPATEPDAAPAPRPARFTVYTARYRLQLKGPDRGKWEADVVEEADAPLLTVDAVVRGVQRRVGDEAEVQRLTGDDLRRILAGPAWLT